MSLLRAFGGSEVASHAPLTHTGTVGTHRLHCWSPASLDAPSQLNSLQSPTISTCFPGLYLFSYFYSFILLLLLKSPFLPFILLLIYLFVCLFIFDGQILPQIYFYK